MKVCDFCKQNKSKPEFWLSIQDLKNNHLPFSPYEICKPCSILVRNFVERLMGKSDSK